MPLSVALFTVLVPDYDEGIAFYVGLLGFELIEDTYLPAQFKRWVVVAPSRSSAALLLAKASTPLQQARIGSQTGERVLGFLHTENFQRDYHAWIARGVQFLESPREELYGTVAVFADPFGNRWDLIEARV